MEREGFAPYPGEAAGRKEGVGEGANAQRGKQAYTMADTPDSPQVTSPHVQFDEVYEPEPKPPLSYPQRDSEDDALGPPPAPSPLNKKPSFVVFKHSHSSMSGNDSDSSDSDGESDAARLLDRTSTMDEEEVAEDVGGRRYSTGSDAPLPLLSGKATDNGESEGQNYELIQLVLEQEKRIAMLEEKLEQVGGSVGLWGGGAVRL